MKSKLPKQKSKVTGFIGPFSHITSDVVCYVHTTNNQEENTWRVTQVNKHLGYEVLLHCLYYVDKITLVRRKKYKVQNISGKFSLLDIWKICMCNLHRHKSQFIKMEFYPKFQEEKKHGMCVLGACLHLRVSIGSSVHQDETIPEFVILVQASCLKALFLSASEAILICSKCSSAAKPPSYTNSYSHALPQILLFISRAFANI